MGRAFEYRRAAKEKRWAKMSRIFPKLARAITVAAKEGGIDPEMNPALRVAIQNAKTQNMPKDNIQAAIDRASGKDAAAFEEVKYEGKGPHGILIMVECATDNSTRTVANVKSYFNKAGGSIVPNGSLEFLFDRKAVFEIKQEDISDVDMFELELIDFGLEEIQKHEGILYLYADYTQFGELSKELEKQGIEPEKSALERIPTSPVDFTDDQMEDIEKLLDKLDEDEDVQDVFTNMA
jgi:YebC/PmpR family DNA-binding regulatory protein